MNLKFFPLLTIFVLISSNVFAADECMTDISRYTLNDLNHHPAIFKRGAPNIRDKYPLELIQYGIREKITLKDDTNVIFVVGGCVHYGFSFEFSGEAITPVRSQEKLKRAKFLLTQLDLTREDERNIFLKAISDAITKNTSKSNDGAFYLPCGDATCTLTDNGDNTVILVYDFPL